MLVSLWGTSSVWPWSSSAQSNPNWSSLILYKHSVSRLNKPYIVMIYFTNACLLYPCFSLSLVGLSLCRVSHFLETQACPLQWPHQTPKPTTHAFTSMYLWTSAYAVHVCICISLTCVLMVSESALNQSLITLSISDWISSSVPTRVFSCRGQSSDQVSGI